MHSCPNCGVRADANKDNFCFMCGTNVQEIFSNVHKTEGKIVHIIEIEVNRK